MAKELETTLNFKADIKDLQKGITEANSLIKLANSEFKAASDGSREWANSLDGLTSKQQQLSTTLDQQQSKMAIYVQQLKLAEEGYGENSRQAISLQTAMNNLQGEINRTESAIRNNSSALRDMGVNVDGTGNQTRTLGTILADTARSMRDGLANAATSAGRALSEGMSRGAEDSNKFGQAIEKVITTIQGGLRSAADTASRSMDSLRFVVASTRDAIGETLSNAAEKAGNALREKLGQAGEAVGRALGPTFVGWIQSAGSALGGVLGKGAELAGQALKLAGEAALGAAGWLGGKLLEGASMAGEALLNGLKAGAEAAAHAVGS